MGFYYRKSMTIGPFQVNVAKSGVGCLVDGIWESTSKQASVGNCVAETAVNVLSVCR